MQTEATICDSDEKPVRRKFSVDPSLLAEHRPALQRFAMMKLRNREQADDAVQETLLAALRALECFSGKSSLRTWLISILKHKIVDQLRAASREMPVADTWQPMSLEDPATNHDASTDGWSAPAAWADPEHILARQRFLEVLERLVAEVPGNSARAFLMREVLGCETREISRELAVSANHCAVILHRARSILRARMSADWFEGLGRTH